MLKHNEEKNNITINKMSNYYFLTNRICTSLNHRLLISSHHLHPMRLSYIHLVDGREMERESVELYGIK